MPGGPAEPSVPYTSTYRDLVASLNGTEHGRQLIPLLHGDVLGPAAAADPQDVADGYLLGYSHNPWGPSSNFKDVLMDHLNASTTTTAVEKPGRSRSRRSVLHLYNMLVCATGCDPMAFKGYGCYCGFLGSGYTVDGIDRCCKMHDWCYDTASCPMFLEYFVPYLWKCYRGRPLCAVNGSACSQRLCECDRRLAECLRNYPCPRRKAVCTSSPWRLLQNLFML
ncbi:hypothetical protein FOCC_FOCC006150 [Frankliniella occidentalis]|nr:hypothetical protein FOCC_FOCC006150 [Frankliniella occidentalis]